jgi:H+/Cl- antiporter ClcA
MPGAGRCGGGGRRPPVRPRRWAPAAAVVLTGIGAGGAGAVLTLLLHGVQHLAYGYTDEAFVVGSQQASGSRRVVAMAVGGAVTGLGWWALRRWAPAGVSVTAAIREPRRALRLPTAAADAVLQITAVGAGASLGREGAPRQLAAALADRLGGRLELPPAGRRTLIACGAGAGLAAVYNVPLGGALFTLEVLLRSAAFADALPAAVTAAIATAVAWPVVGTGPTYTVPQFALSAPLVVGSVLLGPPAGLTGWAFRRLATAARARAPSGWRLPVATTTVFAAVGAVAVAVPLVLGNCKGPAGLAFTSGIPLAGLALLLLLKPLATAACLRSGAVGGLLTPSVATGAVLGALAGAGWTHLWPGSPVGAFAVVGAAAVLACSQRAPLTATVLALEFTHSSPVLLVPVVLAVGGALAVDHLLPAATDQPAAPEPARRPPGPTRRGP